MIKRNIVLLVFYSLLCVGCITRYSIDDQYSYDALFEIPYTDWYARIIDITGERSKELYLSKDSVKIKESLDSISCPIIRINKMHDYPELLVSNDSVVIALDSFELSGDSSRCHLMRSDKIYDSFFCPEASTAKEMADRYSRILPRYPFVALEFETWHNSVRAIPNIELVRADSTFNIRRIEPIVETTKSFREMGIKPSPLWVIRLKELLYTTKSRTP